MRYNSRTLLLALVVGSIQLLDGCSSSGSPGAPTGFAASAAPLQSKVDLSRILDGAGVDHRLAYRLHALGTAPTTRRGRGFAKNRLAVSDYGDGDVQVFDKNYATVHTFNASDGLSGPDGEWYDNNGRLYVADYLGIKVLEFNKAYRFVVAYSDGLIDPVNVASANNSGPVYVADYNYGGVGFIAEYQQGVNALINECAPGGSVEGIAVDRSGDVFVSWNNPNAGGGNITEYKGGLNGCSGKVLAPTLMSAGGLQIDRKGNLVAIDQYAGVDIIKPPYATISSTIGGFALPFHVALNRSQDLMYVADVGAGNVQVLTYPKGVLQTTLGANQGLVDAAGVAAYSFR